MERSQKPEPGDCRTVVHLCVFNGQGELLVQRRAAEKFTYPLRWDVTAAGAVDAGETSRQAAERELREELGYSLSLEGLRPVMTVNFPGGFDDFFVVEQDVSVEKLILQKEEVCDAAWIPVQKAEEMILKKEFCPYPPGFLTVLYSLRHGQGFVDA